MPVTSTPSSSAPSEAPFAEPFAGVLLDLDGTLIDSIAAVERSWIRWCGEYGVDPERLLGFHGIPAARVIETLLPEGDRVAAFERIRDLEVADVAGIVVLPGAATLLATLADGGVPTAIVTSGTRDLAEARIAATGLTHPPVVVTASRRRARQAVARPVAGGCPPARGGPGRLPRRRGCRRRASRGTRRRMPALVAVSARRRPRARAGGRPRGAGPLTHLRPPSRAVACP